MPAIGMDEVWQVVDIQTFLGQEVRNVYHYRATDQGAEITPTQIWTQWEAVVGNTLATAQASGLVHTFVEVQVLGDPFKFGTFGSLVGAGAKGGEPLAPFVAWSAVLRRATKETRDGRKRFAGLVEGDVSGDTIIAGALGPYANTVNTLDQPLVVGGVNVNPVIIRKVKNPSGPGFTPPSSWIWGPVAGATSTFVLTTQNSRKRNVGI